MKRAMAGAIMGLALALAGGAWAEGRAASGTAGVGAGLGGRGPALAAAAPSRLDGKLGWGAMKGYIDGPDLHESAPFLLFWKGEAARRGTAQPPQEPAAARAQGATGQPGCTVTGVPSGRCTR